MEEKIQAKKELSIEEIESQTLLELPDRTLMQATSTQNIAFNIAVFVLTIIGLY
jgi:hypothetical protein